MKISRLQPSFREKIWGTTRVDPWFPVSDRQIGEVWFEAEPPVPILVKFLFTAAKLSIQVHPDDTPAGPGKTEMWHVLRAAPGAALGLGFVETLTPGRLREAARSGEVERLLDWAPVLAGETYFIPAGTVHAIGEGLALCEIQQNSDVTYRLYDYGRPRELHLDQGLAVARLEPHPGKSAPVPLAGGRELLVLCPHFVTEAVRADSDYRIETGPAPFELWITLEGSGTIGGHRFAAGEVWMVSGGSGLLEIRPATAARFLRTYPPASPPPG